MRDHAGAGTLPREVDAVVIGAGPNGLVAANALADAGWDVLVLEAEEQPGGAVRTAEVVAPGFRSDLFSAFYPLAAASPVIRDLHLEEHGLAWRRSPDVLAHALDDGSAAVLHPAAEDTAAALEAEAAGDGEAWLDLVAHWRRVRDPLLDALFRPLPPTGPALRLLRRTGTTGALDLVRLALLPVRRLGDELFRGTGAPLLLTGNAMHADLPPNGAGSGLYGWLLTMLAQDVGYPVPAGGAGALPQALVGRFRAAGGELVCGTAVDRVVVSGGRAVAVRTAGGDTVRARRAVLADVSAPALYRELLAGQTLPLRLARQLERFEWDAATLKVNWAVGTPIPWAAEAVRGAGTVHLGVDLPGFLDWFTDLAAERLSERPFLLFGQMTTADPLRSPSGTESAWGYTHLPRSLGRDPQAVATLVQRVEQSVERVAPGFLDAVVGRFVQSPADLEGANRNLDGGAVNGGTAGLHQQLVLRPTPGLGRPETYVDGLFLASASAHPGGGVHGACGWNAALAALRAHGRLGAVHQALARTAWRRLLGSP